MTAMTGWSPTSLTEYQGQDRMKVQLTTAIVQAKAQHRAPDHMFLHGPSGFGKTTLAKMVATELDVEFASMYWPPVSQDRLARLLQKSTGVLLLDEIHRGSQASQEWLLPVIAENYVEYKNGRRVELNNLTIIGATTEQTKVTKALRRRFKLNFELERYNVDQMQQMITRVAERLHVPMEEESLHDLAAACCGKPGNGERLLNAAQGLFIQWGSVNSAMVLEHLDIDEDGLERQHRLYLLTLDKFLDTGKSGAGLNAMADAMSMPNDEIREIEELLQDMDLIMPGGGQGREFTQAGDRRVSIIKREAA